VLPPALPIVTPIELRNVMLDGARLLVPGEVPVVHLPRHRRDLGRHHLRGGAVAEFDSEEQAAGGPGPVQGDVLASSAAEVAIPFGEVVVDDIGDRARAYAGTAGEDGVPFEVSYLMVQDGPYLYVIAVVGIGAEVNTIDTASAIARRMIAVDPGDGDGVFDESGGSSGGLWDTFPDEGEEVVEGLTIESDGVLSPEPAEAE
jgi:hypothetical protein